MKTAQQYRDSLFAMKPNIHMGGEQVGRDDPRLLPGINVMSLTYEMAQDPRYDGLVTATSHITGNKVNRFCHVHRSPEDLLKKQEITRICNQQVGFCIQRCMGADSLSALSVVTHETDQALSTQYHQRFLKFLEYFQENDLAASAAQTDVKGDRSKRPHQQTDPNLYLRVVDKGRDGIVVRGAKIHTTMAVQSHEIIVLPTRALTPEEGAWAVAFAIPSDTEGVHLINRASAPRARSRLQAPLATYGSSDSFTVFDNIFVPWERVFMCGETQFAGRLAMAFALFHRHSYTGCKPAMSDVLMGLMALVAEYNGVEKADHIRHKLADMIGIAELVYASGVAAAMYSEKTSSGTYLPHVIYTNVGRRLAGEKIYHEYDLLADIAGGLPATLPFEEDFYNEKTAAFLDKYMVRNPKVSSEEQHRCFRLLGDYLCSGFGGVWQVAGVHGGGSPIMETIGILGSYDLEAKKNIARRLAGILPK